MNAKNYPQKLTNKFKRHRNIVFFFASLPTFVRNIPEIKRSIFSSHISLVKNKLF